MRHLHANANLIMNWRWGGGGRGGDLRCAISYNVRSSRTAKRQCTLPYGPEGGGSYYLRVDEKGECNKNKGGLKKDRRQR